MALVQDWPRIPAAARESVFARLRRAGPATAALLDTEAPWTASPPAPSAPNFRDNAVFRRADGNAAEPAGGDLDLTAGWGHAGQGGVTMPGRGKTAPQGTDALDIYLNDSTCGATSPSRLELHHRRLPSHQKMLSYPRKTSACRPLTP
jgi:hypothetical protein